MNAHLPGTRWNRTLVQVLAPARLHLGFLDLHGGLGRRFGSLGLTLDALATRIHVEPSDTVRASGPGAERVVAYARTMCERLRLPYGVDVTVHRTIPEHVGLGSGTQLGLAVGAAVSRLAGLDMDAREIAQLVDRGARSGIGIGAFQQGGFLVDGGRGEDERPPPLVARMAFPEQWRVILIFDDAFQGLHGRPEQEAFRQLPPFPESAAAHLCRLVLMRLLPGLAEQDLTAFGRAITEIQQVVGDHFAPAQGGRFASPGVSEVLTWLSAEGYATVGQSSWGPTGFTVLDNHDAALVLLRRLQARWGGDGRLQFMMCQARNQGGEVTLTTSSRSRGARLVHG